MKFLCSFLAVISLFASCGKAPLFKEFDNSQQSSAPLMATSRDELTFGKTAFSFGLEWVEGPYSLQKSSFRLRFWNPNNASIWGPYEILQPKLCVMLWMRMPDGSEHGSAPLTITTDFVEKIYYVDDVYFVMNGWWQIRVRSIDKDQKCGSLKTDAFIEEEVIEIYID